MIPEDHQEEMISVRDNITVLRTIVDRDHQDLFGNGQPGIIATIHKRLDRHDQLIWVGIGIIIAVNFLSGTGVFSLHSFLGK